MRQVVLTERNPAPTAAEVLVPAALPRRPIPILTPARAGILPLTLGEVRPERLLKNVLAARPPALVMLRQMILVMALPAPTDRHARMEVVFQPVFPAEVHLARVRQAPARLLRYRRLPVLTAAVRRITPAGQRLAPNRVKRIVTALVSLLPNVAVGAEALRNARTEPA